MSLLVFSNNRVNFGSLRYNVFESGSRLPVEGPRCDITFGPNSSGEISPNAAHTRAHKLPKEERQHQLSLACRLYFNSQRIWHQQTAEKRLTRHCIVSHLERLLAVARYIDFSDLFCLWMQRNLLHKCNIDKGLRLPSRPAKPESAIQSLWISLNEDFCQE